MDILSLNRKAASTVRWDPVNGIGAVPWNQEVNERGFVLPMTYEDFRKLVPPGNWDPEAKEYMIEAHKQGKSFGNPFLLVRRNINNTRWIVEDHEGRSRSDAAHEIDPNVLIPVHIFPTHLRAKDITPEMKSSPFVPQGKRHPITLTRQSSVVDILTLNRQAKSLEEHIETLREQSNAQERAVRMVRTFPDHEYVLYSKLHKGFLKSGNPIADNAKNMTQDVEQARRFIGRMLFSNLEYVVDKYELHPFDRGE